MVDDKEVKKAEKQSSAEAPKPNELSPEDLEKSAGGGCANTYKDWPE